MSHPRHQSSAADPESDVARLRVRLPTDGSVDLDALRATLQTHLDRKTETVVVTEPEPEPVVQPEPVITPEPVVLPEPEPERQWNFASLVLFGGIGLAAVVMIVGFGFLSSGNSSLGWPLAGVGFLLVTGGITMAWRQRAAATAAEEEIVEPIEEDSGPNPAWTWIKAHPVAVSVGVLSPVVLGLAIYASYEAFSSTDPEEVAQPKPPPVKPSSPTIAVAKEPVSAELSTLAEAGDIEAQFELASRHLARHEQVFADPVEKTDALKAAERYFELAGTNGHPVALYNSVVLSLSRMSPAADNQQRLIDAEERFEEAVKMQPSLQPEIVRVYEALADRLMPNASTDFNTTEKPKAPAPISTAEPEQEQHRTAQEGWGIRLGAVVVLFSALGIWLCRGVQQGDFNHKFYFAAGMRQLIAAQGPHLLAAGIVGLVCVLIINSSLMGMPNASTMDPSMGPYDGEAITKEESQFVYNHYDDTRWFGLDVTKVLFGSLAWAIVVGLPFSMLIVLMFAMFGVDLMPTIDRQIASDSKPAWRQFLRRKANLIGLMSIFIGLAIAIFRVLPVSLMILPWLQYSLGLGLLMGYFTPRGKFSMYYEGVPTPQNITEKVSFRSTIRENFAVLLFLSLIPSWLMMKAIGADLAVIGANTNLWIGYIAATVLILGAIAWMLLVKPKYLRLWLGLTTAISVIALVISWMTGPAFFWLTIGIALAIAVFAAAFTYFGGGSKLSNMMPALTMDGRLLMMPEVDRPTPQPLIAFSNDGKSKIQWGGLAGMSSAMVLLMGVAGFYVWGITQIEYTYTDAPQIAQQPSGSAKPKPPVATAEATQLANDLRVIAKTWRDRPVAAGTLPAMFDKLAAGFIIPNQAAMLDLQDGVRSLSQAQNLRTLRMQFTGSPVGSARVDQINLHPKGRWLVETKPTSLVVWDLLPPDAPGKFVLVQQIIHAGFDPDRGIRETRSSFNTDGAKFGLISPNDRLSIWQFSNGKLHSRRDADLTLRDRLLGPNLTVAARKVISNGVQYHVENLFDLPDAKRIQSPGRAMHSFVFSPDNTHAAVSSDGGGTSRVELWDWREPRMVAYYPVSYQAQSLTFSPDGSRLYAVDAAKRMTGWKTNGQREALFRVPLNAQSTVRLMTDPAGKWILAAWSLNPSGAGPFNWQVADATSGAMVFGAFRRSDPKSFSPDGRYLVANGDSNIQIYDLVKKTATPVQFQKSNPSQIYFTADNGNLIVRPITEQTVIQPHDFNATAGK